MITKQTLVSAFQDIKNYSDRNLCLQQKIEVLQILNKYLKLLEEAEKMNVNYGMHEAWRIALNKQRPLA